MKLTQKDKREFINNSVFKDTGAFINLSEKKERRLLLIDYSFYKTYLEELENSINNKNIKDISKEELLKLVEIKEKKEILEKLLTKKGE